MVCTCLAKYFENRIKKLVLFLDSATVMNFYCLNRASTVSICVSLCQNQHLTYVQSLEHPTISIKLHERILSQYGLAKS